MKNYQTRTVCLWIANDEAYSRYWQEVAEKLYAEYSNGVHAFCLKMADRLAEEHKARAEAVLQYPHLESGLWRDFISAALREVDWYAIAEDYYNGLTK